MSAIQILGWTIVHSLWQCAFAAAGFAALLPFVPARAARTRYALGVATLLLMLALPLATGLRMRGEWLWTVGTPAPADMAVLARHLAARIGAAVNPTLPWIVTLWLAGVLALSLRLAAAWRATRRLVTMGTRPAPDACTQALAHLAARLRITRPVCALESALVRVPAVIGWLRPVVLIPASALTGLTPLQLDALLAHELAHIRRHDYVVNLLQSLIETLLFYHPAVWWVSRFVRQEREHCCDDVAVAVCGDARCYATALFGMERLRVGVGAPALAASGGSLRDRIQRLMDPASTEVFPRWIAGVAVVTLALALGVGAGLGRHARGHRALATSPDSLITLAKESRDPRMRHDAVKELGHAKGPHALVTLIAVAQNDPDGDVRDEAVESLGRFPDTDAVRVLATIARRDPDEEVKQQAVETLGEMQHGAGLPVVIDIARTHPDPEVRREAVESIRDEVPSAAAVPILREIASRDPDRHVQRKAERALAKLSRAAS